MKGWALQVRMLRMSASQACTWGVPRCRKLTTASWPVSSSLHSSVSGLPSWLLLQRPRPCSCFSFLYLRGAATHRQSCAVLTGDMHGESVPAWQHARMCQRCQQITGTDVM